MSQKNSNISAALIYDAMFYFKNLGYEFITCPMLVDEDVLSFTMPKGRQPKRHNGKCYVGSAEQSIYQMIKDGKYLPAKVLAITPCQRDEELFDETHQEIFLKIELACTDESITYQKIAMDVMEFYLGINKSSQFVNFGDSLDIEINGIEVGSYGQRTYNGRTIHYGTGLALPRFLQASNIN